MPSSILLKNGTLLLHDSNDVIRPTKADLMIENTRIIEIAENINAEASRPARIIDCTGKIVSPGFIDTHHHVWQTCLKATHADETLLDYFWSGNFINALLSPNEVFWSQLAGGMECVDSGTTTVVDHASVNYSPQHSTEALRATIGSGIRSIFAYCPTPRVAQWAPEFKLESDMLPPWVMETFDELALQNPFGPSGRVRLGFAFDGLWIPAHEMKALFAKVRGAGAQLITSHSVYNASFRAPNAPTAVSTLNSNGLLGPDILLSHNNNPKAEDTEVLCRTDAKVSSTPSTELQMGQGNPVCLETVLRGRSSLGIDCHSVCSAYIPGQMMTVLQWARGRRHEEFEKQGKWAKAVGSTVSDVYNLGTILGARSVGMEADLGSLAVGKKADIVIFDCTTPGMLVAADRDPVAAIVLHSSIRDVETVIVDGIVRKEYGVLRQVVVPRDISSSDEDEGEAVEWKDVVRHALALSREVDERKKSTIIPEIAQRGVMKEFYMNADTWSDSI